jgi:thermostable 8-oxoguanine DNA glycosylase
MQAVQQHHKEFLSKKNQYLDYWEQLRPKNKSQLFLSWLFSYLTIHSTWESTVKGFTLLKDYEKWVNNKEVLKELLIESRCGLHNLRTNYLSNFSENFWQDSTNFYLTPFEQRKALLNNLKGIGIAKISFALELSAPMNNECVCIDTHILKLFNLRPQDIVVKKNIKYYEAEQKWLSMSEEMALPPVILRAMYWDKLQNQDNTSYWGDCLLNAYKTQV